MAGSDFFTALRIKLATNMNKTTECFPMSEEEKKKKLNKEAKIRMRKYRERKKELNKSQNLKHTRAKEQELEKKTTKMARVESCRKSWLDSVEEETCK